jgi:D-alanine-D-alanine ligase-like ATP-grasp enzyme
MRGVGRIDVRIDEDGRAFVFDTNESPPPLGGTAYAVAMASLGFSVVEMLAVWLGVCFRDFGII